MKNKKWAALAIVGIAAMQPLACSDFSSCTDSRSCPSTSAEAGEGGTGGTGDGGTGEGGTGEGGDGGANHSIAGGENSAGSSGDSAGMSPVPEGGDGGMPGCAGADLNSDPANCGTCGNNCASSPNLAANAAGITCKDAMCVIPDSACAAGRKHCSANPTDVCETDVTTSAKCGACTTKCDAAQVCTNGMCADSCPADATKCTSGESLGCYPLASTTDHCAACDNACPVPPSNGTASCQTSSCKIQCNNGYHQCNTSAECEANNDATHCGPTCKQCETSDPNAVPSCSNNTCTYPCATGYQFCGFCISKNDQNNCGSCGNACGNGKMCVNGACITKDGAACVVDGDCASGKCGAYYVDADKDGYGTGGAMNVCGVTAPTGFATNSSDCCDADPSAKPGQTAYFGVVNACGNFDYNCLNGNEPDPTRNQVASGVHCNIPGKSCVLDTPGWIVTIPACGQDGSYQLNCGYYNISGAGEGCGAGVDVANHTQLCH